MHLNLTQDSFTNYQEHNVIVTSTLVTSEVPQFQDNLNGNCNL